MKQIQIILIKHCCTQGVNTLHHIMNELKADGIECTAKVQRYNYSNEIRQLFKNKGIGYNNKVAHYIIPEMDNFIFSEIDVRTAIFTIKQFCKSFKDKIETK